MLRKKTHVVRKKTHVVRKFFYVASIFGGAAGRKNRSPWELSSTPWELSSTASRRRQRFQCVYRAPSFLGALIQVYRTPIDFYPPSLCPAHDGGCFFASRPAKALFEAQNCLRNDACQEALHSQWTHRAAGHNGGTWPCGRAGYPHHQRTFSRHKPPVLRTKAYPTEVKEVNFAYNPYLCRQFVPAHPPA